MVNTMQSEGNSECIYISDESPSVPQLSSLSKSSFEVSDVSNNISASLIDEIEMEDVSDDVIVPVTPSPLLNNKRQQHITIGRGIKRTCLEKAFSTMSTSSNNCTTGVDAMDYHFSKEEMFPENNTKSINRKDGNITFPVTSLSKNDAPSKERERSFPHKLISKNNIFNSSKNGILKPENSLNDIQALGKQKLFIPVKGRAVIINSDSEDSTDNVANAELRNILHPIQSNYKLKKSKEHTNENKILQKNRTATEHCALSNKSYSETLLENCGLMKTKKFTNKYSGASLNIDSSNRGKPYICKESNFQHAGLHQDDVYSVPPSNKSLKNHFRTSKRNPKTTRRDNCHELEGRPSTTGSYNNSKSPYSINKSRNHADKNAEGATNQRNCSASCAQINATAGTSSKCENNRVRRKHSHRGQIAKYPVEESDTDVEFYDAKSDLSDLADSKRPTKANRKKKPQRRHRRILEYLSSDSSSDISVVSEMRVSPCNHRTSKQHVRNTESPDPVEQVRQMEEDERLAYMLQAQFDAELEGNDSNEEFCADFHSSILSNLSVDSASSSSDSSSTSSAAAEEVFPFLLSTSLSPRILRDTNSQRLEQIRRSSRIQQRQQSIIGWMPESVRTVLTAWMPNFSEDNTYESLLEISEQIGEESRGLKKQQINGLPTRKFSSVHMMDSSPSASGSRECQDCTICLCEYQNNDILRSLPCYHEFHAACIDKWLKSHSTCPICRIEVSLRRQFGRKRKS